MLAHQGVAAQDLATAQGYFFRRFIVQTRDDAIIEVQLDTQSFESLQCYLVQSRPEDIKQVVARMNKCHGFLWVFGFCIAGDFNPGGAATDHNNILGVLDLLLSILEELYTIDLFVGVQVGWVPGK